MQAAFDRVLARPAAKVLAAAVAVLALALVATATAAARPERSKTLYDPQAVTKVTLASLHTYWKQNFQAAGVAYHAAPYYWWYNQPGNGKWIKVPTNCDNYQASDGWMWGGPSSAYSPNSFYCPTNENIYLDWTFLNQIGFQVSRKWGRGDDARVALVVAHEYGHHIQHLLKFPEVKRAQGQVANFELQADCYAGAWFAFGEEQGIIERGDTLNANTLLGYLGDADGTPWNEASAHGGHSDRQEWFTYGYDTNDPSNCDKVFQ